MELRDYLQTLRAHWIALVVLTLVGALAGFGWSALQPRVYTADASGYVAPTQSDGSTGSALVGDQLAQSKVTSYVNIGSWRSVAEYAIDDLGLDTTPEALVARVNVTNPTDSVTIQVTANAPTPVAARDLAEAWVRGMIQEVNAIESGSTGAATGAVTLLTGDSARLPTAPSSPDTRLNVAIGGGVGLALGIAYAAIRRYFDRRVRSVKEIEKQVGVAVVGTLPLEKELDGERKVFAFDSTVGGRSFAHTEAMRELRTNLQYIDVDDPPRVIVVTSPLPGDGKSTTAANLATSLAASGDSVVLIDADMRRPVVASIFGLPNDLGLSDILAGRADIGDVARPVDADGRLYVIPAGRTPPNPSEMLGSNRMRSLMSSLSAEMTVIIDSPPTIPVSDAAILTASADGALLVISAGKTTFDLLQKAVDNIGKAKGHMLGIVLNKIPRRGAGAYYGYGYAGRHGYGNYYGNGPTAAAPGSTTAAADETPAAEPAFFGVRTIGTARSSRRKKPVPGPVRTGNPPAVTSDPAPGDVPARGDQVRMRG